MDIDHLLQEEEEPEKVWLITYSDMVTLLLAIFVVIASVSQIDESKFEEIQDALHKSVSKTKFHKPLKEVRQKLEEVVLKEKLGYQVFVKPDPRGLVIEFRSNLLFDIGDDTLLGPGENLLKSIASGLTAAASAGYTIAVEGHTDNVPISSPRFRSNWELSTNRATTVIRHLAAQGIPREQLMASGFADIKPKVPNDTPEHRAANRRVVIKVLR
ncbi:MAG: flagellar motor protein MotB [Candidatus Sericytochromatia bacterium]|nr:flagellar motor protein MotB [Candidatus Tanganyikabacteria bacterium]